MQCYINVVIGVDQGVGGGGVNMVCIVGCQYSSFIFDVSYFICFNFDGYNIDYFVFVVFDKINGVLFVQEGSIVFEVCLIQCMQQCVIGMVSCGIGMGCLSWVVWFFGLVIEWMLVNVVLFGM